MLPEIAPESSRLVDRKVGQRFWRAEARLRRLLQPVWAKGEGAASKRSGLVNHECTPGSLALTETGWKHCPTFWASSERAHCGNTSRLVASQGVASCREAPLKVSQVLREDWAARHATLRMPYSVSGASSGYNCCAISALVSGLAWPLLQIENLETPLALWKSKNNLRAADLLNPLIFLWQLSPLVLGSSVKLTESGRRERGTLQ